MNTLTAANKAFVTEAVIATMQKHDASAFDRWWSTAYIQHDPASPDGTAPQKQAVAMLASLPNAAYTIARVIADQNLVAVHGRLSGMGPVAMIVLSLFRVEDGKMVEHWSTKTPEAAQTANGHSQIDGAAEVIDRDKTNANKAFVSEAVDTLFVKGQFDKLANYFAPDYIQHNPMVADGLEGLAKGAEEMAKHGMTIAYRKIHRVIGEGNFVVTHSEGTMGAKPTAFFDIFRVEAGKIVEHWDVIQEVPGESRNANGMF